MEFYERVTPQKSKKYTKFIIVDDDGTWVTYDKNMKRISMANDKQWRTKLFSSFSLITNEEKIAKLMLIFDRK